MIRLRVRDTEETLELGRWIGRRLPVPSVVGLDGELGAGKTWMAKGLVQGIGDYDQRLVKSPAYNLVHEYVIERESQTVTVIHIDFYRLDDLSDMDFLLFSEYFDRTDAIVLVEWANKFLDQLAPNHLSVTLSPVVDAGPTVRDICMSVTGASPACDALLRQLQEEYAHSDH